MKRINSFQNNRDTYFHLTQLINEVVITIAPDAKSKKIEIITHVSELLPLQVGGSREQVRQVLEEVLHYLLRYSNWGNIFLTVDSLPKKGRKSKEKINIRFTFQDSGVCAAVGNCSDKLDANNLIHASLDDLKFFAIKQTIESMQGSLVIESSNNITTIVLCLPFQIKSDIDSKVCEGGAGYVCPSDKSCQKMSCCTVLVIEDDPICQNVFKVLLEELGCVAYIAGTAQMGLKFLEDKPDILFVDIGLPDRDGMSLVKEMREKCKVIVPIVAVTAYEWDPSQFVQVGFTEVMKKPISRDKIKHTLFRLLPPNFLRKNSV